MHSLLDPCELRGTPGLWADWVTVWGAGTTVRPLTACLNPVYSDSPHRSWTWLATQTTQFL